MTGDGAPQARLDGAGGVWVAAGVGHEEILERLLGLNLERTGKQAKGGEV